MLRRLKVRGRLMLVIAVPLVLLLLVAVPEVVQRWDRATSADGAADLTRAATDITATVDALQQERVLSAALRAGAAEQVAQALADQRLVTDAEIERGTAALARAGALSSGLAEVAATATGRLAGLDDVRTQTDRARSIVPWVDPFAPLVDALLVVQEGLGSAVADTGVGNALVQAALLARSTDAAAAQTAQVAAAAAWGELRGDQSGILTDLRADELAYRTAYLAATAASTRVERRAEVNQRDVTNAGRVVDEVLADGDVSSAGPLLRWLDTGTRRQVALGEVEAARAADGLREAVDLGQASRQESTAYLALAGVGLLLALSLALLAARSITRPLRRLTDAADHLAEERLPRLVDALRHPGDDDERYLAATIEPIEVGSDDELAHLGRAFNTVQAVAVDVAAQQADLLRKGISDLYVNLARRNQSLVERQIQLLDRLEAGEEDPEVLEHLFLLDHLATRMRRNAESLLVLAGAESGTRRARPTDVVDVVRAALSEVEAYERVELGALAPAMVQGLTVSDVAHLVAELLENATSFSPPDTTVRVDGIRVGGSYQLVITDHGLGMPAAQLDELNAVLRDPPVTGLALGRSLGCLVAARLAARHGITVRLRPAERGGVAAFVVLPRAVLAPQEPVPAPGLALGTLAALDRHVPVAPLPDEAVPPLDGWTLAALDRHVPVAPAGELAVELGEAERTADGYAPEEPRPARLRDALPSREVFEAGLRTLLAGDPLPVEPDVPAPEPPVRPDGTVVGDVAEAALPAVAELEPLPSPDRQALRRRVPGASGGGQVATSSAERARRSPDEVRENLMRYRSGLRAGRAAAPGREERP